MWTVVNFEADNTVDVVPNFWFKNGLCEWPNKTNRMDTKTTIKRRIKPDEIHFKKYKARVMLTNIASFEEAESKATKAQVTSELSSNEDHIIKATKSVKKTKNNIPTETVVSKLPNPPIYLEESDNESTADDSDKDISYRPGNISDTTLSHDSNNQSLENETETTGNGEIDLETIDIPEFSGSAQKRMKMYYKNDHSLSTQENHIPEHGLFISPSTAAENETDQSFKKFIKRSLTTLKYDVESIHKRMDVFEILLEKIDDKLSAKSNSFAETFATHEDINIIETDFDLSQMENKLTNDSLYRSSVVKTLSRFLSNSLPETIRKMMQTLFSDTFLMNYSYIGFKGKNQFSTLQSCSIIFEAVRSIKKFADIPNMEVEKPLKNWMAQAAQREKLKKQKNDQK
ncbi:uncharacterized protein LOC132949407 [Metopolophium dirhodum]|uniref:uncharacterized protein LOC132949407 n=1 Tax=Metopolophium dirhodum TaxID=44670 RepID=UPI00298F7F62|nr:uncharacterized protein LOC132949407 [Metopolophium dirhodum]